ncbi:hypothetical protein ACK8HJ_22690 [Vreelandella titanicae]|jgi:hypothetical protein|uniref:hypothetical protein n=1 Tax=Vreelandella titanicae TaxID=664683 RepID=UPI000587D6A3|nr:hypothetical protein [Halomonas titanicae]NVE89612.1 hypothetical protein [Halomonas titanicae]|tara:strand:+ start:1832 stop:2218 length:387 start_codon:yes stop_codon:yes gene_type:complete
MKDKDDNFIDEVITHNNIQYMTSSSEIESILAYASISDKKGSVYVTTLNFTYNGMRKSVAIHYNSPVEAPRREEVVILRFNDFGTIRRISASVEYVFHEFYPAGTVSGVNNDGYIVKLQLHGVTDQPL